MSKQVALVARPRVGSGKGEARSLRRDGRVPAVAYGAELDATAVSVDARDLYQALTTEAGLNAIVRLEMDGDSHLALAREIQRHPVRREILHVDFVTISADVKVTVDVPIVLEGTAPGTEEGGVADQQMHTLHVEVLPLEVPDRFVLDISDMQVGDVKRVTDLDLPAGVTVLDDVERTVVTVSVPTLEIPEPEEVEEELLEGELVEGEELPEGEEPPEGEAEAAAEDSETTDEE